MEGTVSVIVAAATVTGDGKDNVDDRAMAIIT